MMDLPHGNFGLDGFMSVPELDEDGVARTGEPLPEGTPLASDDEIIAALKEVYDPEIPVNIYDLGLIYSHIMDDKGNVSVEMTLTAPGCPVAGILPGQVAEAVAGLNGTGEVSVQLTWDPPWDPSRMSDEARLTLDMY